MLQENVPESFDAIAWSEAKIFICKVFQIQEKVTLYLWGGIRPSLKIASAREARKIFQNFFHEKRHN